MPSFYPRRSGAARLALAGLLLGATLPAGEALARTRAVRKTSAESRETAAVHNPSERPISWTAGEPEARACVRSRRKLWQGADGWVVKAVKVCP